MTVVVKTAVVTGCGGIGAAIGARLALSEADVVLAATDRAVDRIASDARDAVTGHAALPFARCLAISHDRQGICVSCLCPVGVDTSMLWAGLESSNALGAAATEARADATTNELSTERRGVGHLLDGRTWFASDAMHRNCRVRSLLASHLPAFLARAPR